MISRHMRAWTLAAAAMTLAHAACGGDDDDAGDSTTADTATVTTADAPTTSQAASTSTTTTVESTTPATTSATDSGGDEFCTTVVEAQQIATAGPDVDFEAASEEEIAAAMEEFSAALVPLLDDLTGSAPEEIAEDLQTIDEALRSGIETGDDPASQPGFMEADRNVDQYIADNCGFEIYPVRAVEYAFEDVPSSIESGVVGFDLQNEGQELHEFVLFRVNDDVDASIEELLEMPEDEALEMIEFVGATFAEPGESDMSFHDLRPGRYGAVCFIPVGTTDMSMLGEGESAAGDDGSASATAEASASTTEASGTATSGASAEMGPPHFTQGMFVEFEVTEATGGSGSGSSGTTTTTTSGGSDSSSPSTTSGTDEESETSETSDSSPSTTDDSGSSTTSTTTG